MVLALQDSVATFWLAAMVAASLAGTEPAEVVRLTPEREALQLPEALGEQQPERGEMVETRTVAAAGMAAARLMSSTYRHSISPALVAVLDSPLRLAPFPMFLHLMQAHLKMPNTISATRNSSPETQVCQNLTARETKPVTMVLVMQE